HWLLYNRCTFLAKRPPAVFAPRVRARRVPTDRRARRFPQRSRPGGPMNKHDVIVKIAKDTGITKTSAAAAVDSLIDGIMRSLKKGDSVSFVGFGTFKTAHRKARKARNPQ